MSRGLFIVFEGINGAGKTTIINNIMEKLNNKIVLLKTVDNDTIELWNYYKFPNRTTIIGQKIDKFLKNELNINSIDAQSKIFSENRKEFRVEMEQLLKKGYNIICDRYTYSNAAYTLSDQTINIMNNNNKIGNYTCYKLDDAFKYDKGLLKPDLVFLINGDLLHLRNEPSQRYHNDKIKNILIFNNYILALHHTNTRYIAINNELNKLEFTVQKIINLIHEHEYLNKTKFTYL